MLFTSAAFMLLFLPLVWGGFFLISHWRQSLGASWLFLVSVFFYGVWMPQYTMLLLGSIVMNFLLGRQIGKDREAGKTGRVWLLIGVGINLALLAYYKYANFFVENLQLFLGSELQMARVLLPIGISFFTFTQIAFLADSYQKGVRELRFSHYGLFVTYFPHLVAGPVLHHGQMMPQFADPRTYKIDPANCVAGLCILLIGLFKKVVLADGVAPYADAVFRPTDLGFSPSSWEAWLGAVAYSLQLYFDFSGYSDMAIGISLLFNVRLPYNFNSPYQSGNISEFWRRWHISLSNFLRDYLYISLGGNRKGAIRRYVNLGTTMVLGGLWHGASWSFVLWGTLHGVFLMLNHGFRALCGERLCARLARNQFYRLSSWALTLVCVIVAWVFFRAETMSGALRMLAAMSAWQPAEGVHRMLWEAGLKMDVGWLWCGALGAVACLAPNSNRIGEFILAKVRAKSALRALGAGLSLTLILVLIMINTARDSVSAFIYFNF
ncbi:MBOAT family O-acyltransferase [Roseateles sp.]|uniref:MBOAT family O-acyltransferase n=1 Tax=Roseateles sp. TaxID=1971397 RepID=UPI003BA80D7C